MSTFLTLGFASIDEDGLTDTVNKDIVCGGDDKYKDQTMVNCNSPQWVSPQRKAEVMREANFNRNPVMKDTLTIPVGGYAIVRIRTDNPGKANIILA